MNSHGVAASILKQGFCRFIRKTVLNEFLENKLPQSPQRTQREDI